jgi:hypothetical protein
MNVGLVGVEPRLAVGVAEVSCRDILNMSLREKNKVVTQNPMSMQIMGG